MSFWIESWSFALIAVDWTIRIAMLIYVPQRRPAAAARTWLLLIFLQPILGLLIYASIGRIYLPKRRLAMQNRATARIRSAQAQWLGRAKIELPADIAPELFQAVLLARNLGDLGIVDGNEFEFIDDYDETIRRLIADIDAAQCHVHLLFYIFADDDTGRLVADAVGRAARRGVNCRVLMDASGSARGLRKLTPKLRRAGVSVTAMLPVGIFRRKGARFDLRNHRKIVVIDGRIGYAGSLNIANAESQPGLVNEELVVRMEGPIVSQLQVVFLADRYIEREEKIDEPGLFPESEAAGTAAAQVLPSGPGYRYANAHKTMVALIHGAKKRVVITTPYFIPDDAFVQAMQIAVLRGAEVHLVVSRQADHRFVHLAQQSFYESLLEAGVKIHLYRPRFLHAKHMSIDEAVAFVGSSNVDLRSFTLNNEISVLIYDAAVVRKLRKVQERYFADSDLLTAAEWAQRPLLTRVAQNCARLADSLL